MASRAPTALYKMPAQSFSGTALRFPVSAFGIFYRLTSLAQQKIHTSATLFSPSLVLASLVLALSGSQLAWRSSPRLIPTRLAVPTSSGSRPPGGSRLAWILAHLAALASTGSGPPGSSRLARQLSSCLTALASPDSSRLA